METRILLLLLVVSVSVRAQVGVNTTSPNAQLDIRSSNQAAPTPTDGVLIPKVDAFPATNPTIAQQGMLVYLNVASGGNPIGFYYWNNPTATWLPLKGTDGGTLDQAYDFGGAGVGRTITADAGAVQVNGADGLQVTGTYGAGATIDLAGAGTRMFFNPRKAAFRAGRVDGTQWDSANIGNYSSAFGRNTTASGQDAIAFGSNSIASGIGSGTFGSQTIASGNGSTAFGFETNASGTYSTTFGFRSTAIQSSSAAFGTNTTASGDGSTAFGYRTTASGGSATSFGEETNASGLNSVAFGVDTTASGENATAFGYNTTASGRNSIACGFSTLASGNSSVAFGQFGESTGDLSISFGFDSTASGFGSIAFGSNATASGDYSRSFGRVTTASGDDATAFGRGTFAVGDHSTTFGTTLSAQSYGETVLGIGATTYTPTVNGATQFQTANSTDRLFVIGNALDINNNTFVDAAERSDALIILKNGLTRLPSTTNTMINAADGKAVVTKEYLTANTSGTLDQAYDFGGAGVGRTITADTGAVLVAGADGLQVTGTFGSGANIDLAGAGTRMFFNPRKAALRAGSVVGTEWNDANVGNRSVAFGAYTIASGNLSTAFGQTSQATGDISTAFGLHTVASGSTSTAFGYSTEALGDASTAFGYNTNASGSWSTAFGDATNALGQDSTAFGRSTTASSTFATAFGLNSSATAQAATAFGANTQANGNFSTAFGSDTTATGVYSTSFGRSNTAYSLGETVLGIGATTYAPSVNGATQFRAANATDRLFVVGNAIDANNNNLVDIAERSDALVILKNGNTGIGTSSPVANLEINQTTPTVRVAAASANSSFLQLYEITAGNPFGYQLEYDGSNDKLHLWSKGFAGNDGVRMTWLKSGEVGIGTQTPGGQFELSLNEGRKPGSGTWTIVSDERLKTVDGDYTAGLSEIRQLRPVRYHYKNAGGRTFEPKILATQFSGFLAQDVQRIFPNCVATDSDGYLSLNIHDILIASVNAVKELDAKNTQLSTHNATLQNELREQQALLQTLLLRVEALEKK